MVSCMRHCFIATLMLDYHIGIYLLHTRHCANKCDQAYKTMGAAKSVRVHIKGISLYSFWLHRSNPKQPSYKKKSAALKKATVKNDVKSKVAAKKWL